MDKNIITFTWREGSSIRAVKKNGQFWMAAKDICNAIGYKNPTKALHDYVGENNKYRDASLTFLGQRGGWVLNEQGAAELVSACKKDAAKSFRQILMSEILPYFHQMEKTRKNQEKAEQNTSPEYRVLSGNFEVTGFTHQEFGSLRAVEIDGEAWFVGKDIAAALGYSSGRAPTNAVAAHVDAEDKGIIQIMTSAGPRSVVLVNESGLYSLILSSKLPGAKRFRRWVTAEILPSIRRHGMYAVEELINNPELAIKAFSALKEEREKNRLLEQKVESQGQQIEALTPKARYYDLILNSPNLIAISVIAKDYGWTAYQMNKYLHEKKVQYKQGDMWLLYANYAAEGYTKTRTIPIGDYGCTKDQTCWTHKGRRFLYEFLKKDGILPLIEQMPEPA